MEATTLLVPNLKSSGISVKAREVDLESGEDRISDIGHTVNPLSVAEQFETSAQKNRWKLL